MNTDKTIKQKKEQINLGLAQIIIWTALLLMVADVIYANLAGINPLNKETNCFIHTSVPRWVSMIIENFIELTVVVLLGVFASTLIEKYIYKLKRFFPKNQILAFLYGSILPICSCAAIPLIEVMKQRVSLRVIITFIIAAPLLNPYIIILSIGVMGIKYCILRIISSFVLAVSVGLITDWIAKRFLKTELGKYEDCNTLCTPTSRDPFVKTLLIMKQLLPYILIGGAIGFTLELFNPKQTLSLFNFNDKWTSMAIMLIIGIPIFVCNGADILILKPLLTYTDLSLGSAMVFSLTSSAVCISSIVMLSKFLGKKLTTVLVISIALITLIIGISIDFLV